LYEIKEINEKKTNEYMKISRFEDLDCWKEARILVQKVYDATENNRFGKDTRLARQIQSAATSSMANIAEGFIRKSNRKSRNICI